MTVTAAAGDLTAKRRYRFGPLDRTGVLLGLRTAQCVLLGTAILLAAVIVQAAHSVAGACAAVALAGVLAFARWNARPLHEWLGPITGWCALVARGRNRWRAAVGLHGLGSRPGAVPEVLQGVELIEVEGPGDGPRVHGVGVVCDQHAQLLSATLRVRGREFALLEAADQDRVLDAWGAALGAFCRERSAVVRVCWSEWAAPASLDDHVAFVRAHHGSDAHDEELARYLELVADAGPLTTVHEVLLTVTVARARVSRTRRDHARDPAIEVLLDEVALLARRLDHAGLIVDAPLSAGELATVLRLRCDPTCAGRLARRAHTLGEAAGVVSAHNWAPAAVAVDWRAARVDQSWHRTFWIAEWPRLEVPGDWMAPLVLHSGGVRTLTVVYEPVAPSRSRRAVDRDATRLASDEDQRARRGFRIRAQHRRAEREVLAREAELVAGYPEFGYAGFLTVTSPSPETLDHQSADWEQIAAQTGLELRALDGQHDVGLVTALPVGRAPALRRFA